ncbi:UDP-glucose 4-epimerase GalE [Heliorestis acidaminivorans]|uniref:UDP-glucose 4-epimerase n=1 Tax=Heliorestis acidaminivorans TaxID=553427 RepID=A0A6I0ES20_9FIRM|nr:UDP-glucose 4-epimerase GalE [Heliorestis acidaminivorans]KAB2951555.1 UDP-glucose 4-epimerase GalE [Heliorestis acidaminivorans]
MAILVTGGAGYVGSHCILALLERREEIIIVDDLSTGTMELVPPELPFYHGDIGDEKFLQKIFLNHQIEAVFHFAAKALVGESMLDPANYFINNTAKTSQLLKTMTEYAIPYLIFSSSAAVYGEPRILPIPEEHPTLPQNPYGLSKLMTEQMLQWFEQVHGLRWVALRYFNAAGADIQGRRGEIHDPESHLIPNVLKVASGEKKSLSILGNNYATADGTAIRDYIHVTDLASAHSLAYESLQRGLPSGAYNLGNNRGYSILEVVEKVEQITGKKIAYQFEPARAGDPSVLIASAEKAKKELGWQPRYSTLERILEDAWKWQQSQRKGE